MVKVVAHENGWLIEKEVYFGEDIDKAPKGSLILALHRGEQVRYGKRKETVIDFPGEYDVRGISVKARFANDAMSYLVKKWDSVFACIANAAALDLASFEAAEHILCIDQNAVEEAEKIEFDGDIQLFSDAAEGKAPTPKAKVVHPEDEEDYD